MLEEARITAVASSVGFSGDEKGLKALEDAYLPQALKDQNEQETISKSVRRLDKLFGG